MQFVKIFDCLVTVFKGGGFFLLACQIFSASAQVEFVGSEACASCHQPEYELWQQSHHFQAMAKAGPDTVLGNFNNVSFDYFGITSTFYQRDDRFFVETDNAAGELQEFEIAYTFGVYPLQQYLIEFPDGRMQTLAISWDSRPEAEGGQRWYHLYPDEQVDHEDPLHWTGTFQNWNSRCGSCHSTDFDKNYDLASNTYKSDWHEINVSCESCHGQGGEHVLWANGDSDLENSGLLTSLQTIWTPDSSLKSEVDALLAALSDEDVAASQQKQVCASCHSRRGELAHRDLGNSFYDNHSLTVLSEGLYHPDGQIQDEVYVYGSFLQSKMHQNNVSCTNCHEPHSQQLKIEGNGLCLQCHEPASFQVAEHLMHEADAAGGQCVNCHMPATTYMGVDDRRDHSFKIPDPFASMELGVPNVCTGCHEDRDAEWAAEVLAENFGQTSVYYEHSKIFFDARQNNALVSPALLSLATDTDNPAIYRATAISEARRFPSEETVNTIMTLVESDDPLIREYAVSATEFLPVPNRYQLIQPLITDPVKAVRMEVAQQLAGLPMEQLPDVYRQELITLFTEYVRSAVYNADFPEVMTDAGLFYLNLNEVDDAELAFQQALLLSPGYFPALLNLADLYRAMQREDEGEAILLQAIDYYPESANAYHALGLLYVRTDRMTDAVAPLRTATELEDSNPRFVLVYALALDNIGDFNGAINVLEEGVRKYPADTQLYQLLQEYRNR